MTPDSAAMEVIIIPDMEPQKGTAAPMMQAFPLDEPTEIATARSIRSATSGMEPIFATIKQPTNEAMTNLASPPSKASAAFASRPIVRFTGADPRHPRCMSRSTTIRDSCLRPVQPVASRLRGSRRDIDTCLFCRTLTEWKSPAMKMISAKRADHALADNTDNGRAVASHSSRRVAAVPW
jgi:hypothetical protein